MKKWIQRLLLCTAMLACTARAQEDPLAQFHLGGTLTGYAKAERFLAFLDEARQGGGEKRDAIREAYEARGAWAACLLILVGGLLLNLTPCVLPMIPVNLAIIGAGTAAGSRRRGLVLGAAYGSGIAAVYGVLGVMAVLTGARFGTLNASPWFNVAIAAVFLVLALGMFDIVAIDLSRFQPRVGTGASGRGSLLTALFMGGIAALLAGACVAPAVIAVIVLATDLYAHGHSAGLLLPFLLGVGMALPWPLAGAGLACLPKPGRWMEAVKRGFGAIILLAGLYYGWKGVMLWRDRAPLTGEAPTAAAPVAGGDEAYFTSLTEGLAVAQSDGRPVFVDFWATWCSNCLKMERTTFKDPAVRERLGGFVTVKIQAEDLADPATKAVLDRFGVIGLPTYVVLVRGAATP